MGFGHASWGFIRRSYLGSPQPLWPRLYIKLADSAVDLVVCRSDATGRHPMRCAYANSVPARRNYNDIYTKYLCHCHLKTNLILWQQMPWCRSAPGHVLSKCYIFYPEIYTSLSHQELSSWNYPQASLTTAITYRPCLRQWLVGFSDSEPR